MFLTPLRVEQLGARQWILTDSLVFQSSLGKYVAPRGFQTDFASIPRIAWVLFPPSDRYNAAAVMHDAGYANALLTQGGKRIFLIKQLSGDLFAECLHALGTPWLQRSLMTAAVRVAGDPLGHPLAAHRGEIR